MGEINSKDEQEKNLISINKDLGVGYAEYFRLVIFFRLDSEGGIKHRVAICPYDEFKNLDEMEKSVCLGSQSESFEFMKSSGERYLIGIYFNENSNYITLLDMEFLKHVFCEMDARYDVKPITQIGLDMLRLLIQYEQYREILLRLSKCHLEELNDLRLEQNRIF